MYPVSVAWAIDRGEVGMAAASGLLSPSGIIGGKANVLASVGSRTVSTSVTIRIRSTQNGAAAAGDAGADSGGGARRSRRRGRRPCWHRGGRCDQGRCCSGRRWPTPGSNGSTYDGTVWPRGLLAPQLQWEPGAQTDYDAVLIKITEANYEYQGFFKKNGARFINHPSRRTCGDRWRSRTLRARTSPYRFPQPPRAPLLADPSWKAVASAPLKGIVYYNSYGTKLAKNYTGALGPDTNFGGATLGIRGGSTDPTLVAGDSTAGGCRVCHSVSANGAAMATESHESERHCYDDR